MAYSIEDKPNTLAPNSTYPLGQIQDDTGGGNGTPVNTLVYGDFHQFFSALMILAGVAFNHLPDNAANGYQYITALTNYIKITVANIIASTTQAGILRIATQTEVNAGTANNIAITPLTLLTYITTYITTFLNAAWTAYTPTITGGSGSTITVNSCRYKIFGSLSSAKTMAISFLITDTGPANGSTITIPLPGSYRVGTTFYGIGNGTFLDGTNYPCIISAVAGQNCIYILISDNVTTNANIPYTGSILIEVQ